MTTPPRLPSWPGPDHPKEAAAMTGTDMAVMAQRTLNGFNDHDRASLARDAHYIADAAARYAKRIAEGEPDMGEANRLAQDALQLACLAARLDARVEALGFVDAIADDSKGA